MYREVLINLQVGYEKNVIKSMGLLSNIVIKYILENNP